MYRLPHFPLDRGDSSVFHARRLGNAGEQDVRELLKDHHTVDTASRKARDKVSNGRLLANADLRTAPARRYRHLVRTYGAKLKAGDETGMALARAAAASAMQLEAYESALARGETIDVRLFTRLSNSLSRSLATLERRAADRPPEATSLEAHFAAIVARREAQRQTVEAEVSAAEAE
jgi:hypothetical protein